MLGFNERRPVGLLLNHCSMTKPCLLAWLEVPDFSNAISNEIRDSGYIDDRFLYALTTKIYDKIVEHPEQYPDVKLQNCRRGINQLRRAVESKLPVT